MADLERRLISKVLLQRDLPALLEAGVSVEFFTAAEHRKVFTWMKTYWQEHRVTPTWRRAEEEFPGYRVLVKVNEPLSDCIARVRRAYHTQVMVDTTRGAVEALDSDNPDPEAAEQAMQAGLRRAAQEVSTVRESRLSEVLGAYVETLFNRDGSTGLLGIATGFQTIDEATLGLQAQQLVTLVGTPKVGKSSAMMIMATNVQFQGNPPYFVSFEMSAEEQYSRYLAMGAHVDYHRLVLNKSTGHERLAVHQFLVDMRKAAEFTICTDVARAATISGLEAKIAQAEPAVVFLDGMYLMRDEISGEQNTWTALTNLTREMKKLAQRLDIPIMVSTQALMSKAASRNRKNGHYRLDAESPGYSSSWAQDSDVLMAVEKQNDRPDERLMRVIISRNCPAHEVWVQWDWKLGMFGQECVDETYEDDGDG